VQQITSEELLAIIGAKEAELYLLRRDLAAVRQQLATLQTQPTGGETDGVHSA
jgi:hypothetical protein